MRVSVLLCWRVRLWRYDQGGTIQIHLCGGVCVGDVRARERERAQDLFKRIQTEALVRAV